MGKRKGTNGINGFEQEYLYTQVQFLPGKIGGEVVYKWIVNVGYPRGYGLNPLHQYLHNIIGKAMELDRERKPVRSYLLRHMGEFANVAQYKEFKVGKVTVGEGVSETMYVPGLVYIDALGVPRRRE